MTPNFACQFHIIPDKHFVFSECNVNVWVQVRVQLPEETAFPPGDDPNDEEPTEQNDLLDKDTVAVETSDWL